MTKIITVLGARPQFIKASVVSAELAKHADMTEVVVHTGQHFDTNMSDVFFAELGMDRPAYVLGIHGGSHGEMTGRMIIEVEKVLLQESPDIVLVYGDTNSTLAGALAAVKLNIPVAHVEAGLRSFNMRMPEEVNRILTDRISTWLFTPTEAATANLKREGADHAAIHQVGDVMYDVALHHGSRAAVRRESILQRLKLPSKGYVLATVHRAENTDDPIRLKAITEAFTKISRDFPVVWPLHPRTRAALKQSGWLRQVECSCVVIEPAGYLDMTELEQQAAVIATDSGGVQKEAFFHKVPCVTLRNETEWIELVQAGWNRLIATDNANAIVDSISSARDIKGLPLSSYGDGSAAAKIVCCLGKVSETRRGR